MVVGGFFVFVLRGFFWINQCCQSFWHRLCWRLFVQNVVKKIPFIYSPQRTQQEAAVDTINTVRSPTEIQPQHLSFFSFHFTDDCFVSQA